MKKIESTKIYLKRTKNCQLLFPIFRNCQPSFLQESLQWIENLIIMEIIHIYQPPSARAGYDTRTIFKRSLTGLNAEFFLLLD